MISRQWAENKVQAFSKLLEGKKKSKLVSKRNPVHLTMYNSLILYSKKYQLLLVSQLCSSIIKQFMSNFNNFNTNPTLNYF